MRALFRVLTVLALALLLPRTCALASGDYSYLGTDELIDGLPESAGEILGSESLDSSLDVPELFGRLWDAALDALGDVLRPALAGAVAVLAAAFLCSVARPFTGGDGGDHVDLVGVAVILAACIGGVRTLIGDTVRCVNDMRDLSTLLLPVLGSAAAASGHVASGAAKLAASALFINILMDLGRKLIIPMIYAYLAASAGEAAFGGPAGGVAKLISGIAKHLLTGLVLTFTVYLTATSLIASSADATAVKLTKAAISNLLPVVGGMVSDAADAVASGVNSIGAAAGALGVVATLSVCLLPFLRLVVGSLLYRAAAELSATVADRRLSGLIASVATAHSLALGLAGAEAVMLLISVISAAKIAGA